MARTVNQQRHRQRRDAITAAAATLFARHGFAQTTTAEIAKRAGISPGNLFYYFSDKPAIFRAIFEQDIPTSQALFEDHAETADPARSVLDVVAALAAPARDELAPGLLVELLRQAGNDEQLMAIVATNEAIVQEGLAGLLRQAAAGGQADPTLDADQAAAWVRTIIDATYLNAGQGCGADPLPMLRVIVARFLGMTDASAAAEHDTNTEQESR